MSDSVQKIKERLSILDVISPYVELHKAGKSYKGKSPFTNEKTPSFYVSPDRGMYYCFSSSQGGDMFTFIEAMEGVDFKGALKILAEKAGVELIPEDPKKRSERDRQYELIEEATAYFFKQREANKHVETYIEERGVEGKSVHIWRIGYAPDEWRALRTHLFEKGYTDNEMLKAGLIKTADGGKEPYDVFRDRVMFPISDASGRIVAFSGRTLKKDPETPKYVNSPETELYNKSEILFGYDKAKQGIRSLDFSLIVEGQFDLVLVHQSGYTNAVAVSGTAFTKDHLTLLERLSNRVVLALDSDRAGIAAVKRVAHMLLERGMDIKVAALPDGKDPADIVREGKGEFKKIIGSATHVIEFLLSVLKREARDERTYKLLVREEILPLMAHMPNRIDREHFETIVSEAVGTTKDAIHYELERLLEEERERPQSATVREYGNDVTIVAEERRVSGRKDSLTEYLAVLVTLVPDELKEGIELAFRETMSIDTETARSALDVSKLSALTFTLEAELERTNERNLIEEIVEKLTELRTICIREAIRGVQIELREAEKADDAKLLQTLMEKSAQLQKSLGETPYTEDMLKKAEES